MIHCRCYAFAYHTFCAAFCTMERFETSLDDCAVIINGYGKNKSTGQQTNGIIDVRPGKGFDSLAGWKVKPPVYFTCTSIYIYSCSNIYIYQALSYFVCKRTFKTSQDNEV